MKEELLRVSELNVRAGAFCLRDISFSLAVGEYLAVVGPTGCGKTVLLESLAGLRRVCGGSLVFGGCEIKGLAPERRHMGYSCQDGLLYPFASVEKNILFGARARGISNDPAVRKRMAELVERMEIGHLLERRPAFLSGGERQRVSLARAILTAPRLLLLDEPLSALDQKSRCDIRKLLRDLHVSEGLSFIHVTHDFSEALTLGTSMAVMNAGRIEQKGASMEVFRRPKNIFVAEFLGGENIVRGTVHRTEGQSWFSIKEGPVIGPLAACVPVGPAAGVIRAGYLHLDGAIGSSGLANSWTAIVDGIVVEGTHVDVFCRGGGNWQASVSLSHWGRLRLGAGDPVTLSVGAENVHVISGQGGGALRE